MSVKAYYCDQCGGPIDFAGQTTTVCQICGLNNVNAEAEKAALEARSLAEQFLGDIEELETRLKASGDSQARDYIFRKDILPRLEVVFDDLIEKYDDFFRRPLFHFKILKRYSPLFNVKKVFRTETLKKYSKDFTSKLNQFAMGQLALEVIDLLATSESSKTQIKTYKHHSMFLSRLYNIRGMALDLNARSIKAVINLMELAMKDAEILIDTYSKMKYGATESVKFNAWYVRISLNLHIARIIDSCFQGNYDEITHYFDELIEKVDDVIETFRQKNLEDEESYPLFLTMVITEGFNIDKKVLMVLKKIVNTIIRGDIQANFGAVMGQIVKIIDIADTDFKDVKIESAEWDDDWIGDLEEPFNRLFEILDNLVTNRVINSGLKPVLILNVDEELFDPWRPNEIVEGRDLPKEYYKTKSAYSVRNVIPIYIPIAIMNTYAILKTGFIRKGGDEFESLLLVNPFFRFDPIVNNYGYAKAFSYIDIAENLKEKDVMKNQLDSIDNIVENDIRESINSSSLVLPVLVTQKELEEFVQKTYDLFEFIQDESTPPIPKFFQLYKNVGIAKKVEKLSGELIDYLYVPSLLMEVAEGKTKKSDFVPTSNYEWKLLMPYNNEPKDPFNIFIRMEINPIALLNIAYEAKKLSDDSIDVDSIPEVIDTKSVNDGEVSTSSSSSSGKSRFCMKCGRELKPTDKFCTKCGLKLNY